MPVNAKSSTLASHDFVPKYIILIFLLDIKASNIMFGISDTTVFEKFEQDELGNPTPRKEIDGRIIYTSRTLERPRNLELPVICDFGAARWGDEDNQEDVQPDVYRSPEIILKIPWSYEIDIWNIGCMVNSLSQTSFLS